MSSVVKKLKAFGVKRNPPRYTSEYINEMTNVGFKPEYRTSIKGQGRSLADRKRNIRKFRANWDKAFGNKTG